MTQPVTWTWTSAALPLGSYHIGVEVNDNLNEPVVQYASGLVQELGPALTVTKPDAQVNWQGGGSVDVTYTAYAASGTAEIFYDVDGVGGSGDEVIVAGLITILDQTFQARSLGQVEAQALGRTFRGLKLEGKLGRVAARMPWSWKPGLGAGCVDGDDYDDFRLVPSTIDLDDDGGSELRFGTPLVTRGRYENQDHDPCNKRRVLGGALLSGATDSSPGLYRLLLFLGITWHAVAAFCQHESTR